MRGFLSAAAVAVCAFSLIATPARAADQLPTHFSEFTLTPSTVDVDHDTVTYAGRLVYTDTDGTDKAMPDVNVCTGIDGVCFGSVKTDTDGRFTEDVRLSTTGENPMMVEGNAKLRYQGDREHQYATSDPIYLHVRPAKTRISVAVSPAPKVIGEKVNVTGHLERQTTDGGWTGAPGQVVTVSYEESGTTARTPAAKGTTDADGDYTIPVTVPAGAYWSVQTPYTYQRPGGVSGYGPYLGTNAATEFLPAEYRTQVVGLNVSPEPAGKGSPVIARGRMQRILADGSTAPSDSGIVELQFSTDGKTWTTVNGVNPGTDGNFVITEKAVRDGYWRAYPDPDSGITTASSADYVDVRYRTAISSFNASPEPIRKGSRLTVTGLLKRYTTAWKAYTGQTIKIYFRLDGSSAWTYEGSAKTGSTGRFTRGFTAAKDGTWCAVYAGNSTYMPLTGSGDHVDVR